MNRKNQCSFLIVFTALAMLNTCAVAMDNQVEPSCTNKVKQFLRSPTKQLMEDISGRSKDNCWKIINANNQRFNSLLASVEAGNLWSAKYLAKNLNNLGGGNLEDALIALGKFSDHRMQALMAMEKENVISDKQYTDALTMFPLDLSDNLSAQLNFLEARKNTVAHIDCPDLNRQKASALKAIDEFISEIKSSNSIPP